MPNLNNAMQSLEMKNAVTTVKLVKTICSLNSDHDSCTTC